MADVPFFRTRMGQRYYEHTLPELVRQLTRLNDLLGRTVADDATPAVARRFVVTCVPRREGAGEWFVIDRQGEEPAVYVGHGPESRRAAGRLAKELEDEHGAER